MTRKTKPAPLGTIDARNVEEAAGLKITVDTHRRTPWERQLAHFWGAGTRGEWSLGMCKGCGCHIDEPEAVAVALGVEIALPATVCDDCMEMVRGHYSGSDHDDQSASSSPKWDEACPERLRPIITGQIRPPQIDWAAYGRVTDWTTNEPKGLALMGEEGSGKTSALWALFRKLEASGLNPILLGSLEMARILGEAARDIKAVTWMYRCRVLMIDDLGKERATPGVSSLLWEVLNERYNRNLPILVTSRFSGDSFVSRFGEPHLGEDIRRRMNALCSRVSFSVQTGHSSQTASGPS